MCRGITIGEALPRDGGLCGRAADLGSAVIGSP
jgi:hypothetical protein